MGGSNLPLKVKGSSSFVGSTTSASVFSFCLKKSNMVWLREGKNWVCIGRKCLRNTETKHCIWYKYK